MTHKTTFQQPINYEDNPIAALFYATPPVAAPTPDNWKPPAPNKIETAVDRALKPTPPTSSARPASGQPPKPFQSKTPPASFRILTSSEPPKLTLPEGAEVSIQTTHVTH